MAKRDNRDGVSIDNVFSCPAEEFENNPDVELMWVIKATEHMEIYFNLLTSVDPRLLKLTPHDDKIYEEFRREFPDFNIGIIDEPQLKSAESKEKWRPFCNKFENVVEDFNFGTIIRLDSSGEYSDKNSIFVPRIQFYAIEIARNREGHNDLIRKMFGPSRRREQKNKPSNEAATQYIINSFELALQEFIEGFCLKHKLIPVKLHKLLRKTDGDLKRGDYLLFFGKPVACSLNSHLQQVSEILPNASKKWWLPLSHCKVPSANCLQLFLDRSIAFRNILLMINKRRRNYGMCQTEKLKRIIIHSTFRCISRQKSDYTLIYLRTKLIAQHIGSILSRNGYCVYTAEHEAMVKELSSSNCEKDSRLEETEENLKTKGIASGYICKVDNKDQENSVKKCEGDAFDAKRFLLDHKLPIGPKGYNRNIGYICTNSSSWKEICKHVEQLEETMQKYSLLEPDIVIHISPYNKSYLQQQVGVCLQALSNTQPQHQMFVTHQPVVWKNPEHNAMTAEEYIRQIQQEVQKSLVLKYGKEIIDLPWQKEYLEILSDTIVKFDLLLPSSSVTVKLNHPTVGTLVSRSGTFVQYNCARLSVLFEKHEELVNTGCYPSLPDLESVDFSVLTLQEEWNLLFNYLLVFPQLIQSIIEEMKEDSIMLQIPTHKVCRFLVSLSHDLSTYYSRIHILIEPRPHQLPTVAARLWLLKSLQQVIHNALDLLAISPLQKM